MTEWAYLFKIGIALFAIVNPIGSLPIFISATDGWSTEDRARTARTASRREATGRSGEKAAARSFSASTPRAGSALVFGPSSFEERVMDRSQERQPGEMGTLWLRGHLSGSSFSIGQQEEDSAGATSSAQKDAEA